MIQIPLINAPSQTFTITIGNIEYSIRVIYNTREATWSMDISDPEIDLYGVKLVGGVDVLKQHPITLKNMYLINVSGLTTDPTDSNLADEFALIVATDEELAGL